MGRLTKLHTPMRKLIIAAACVTALSTAANAQISIAPEAGLNLANQQRKLGDEAMPNGLKLGFKAGANVNVPLGDYFVLQPGLFYSIKGVKFDKDGDAQNITLHYA